MQKSFEIEQGVPEIWGFKGLEIIQKRGKNTTVGGGGACPLFAHL